MKSLSSGAGWNRTRHSFRLSKRDWEMKCIRITLEQKKGSQISCLGGMVPPPWSARDSRADSSGLVFTVTGQRRLVVRLGSPLRHDPIGWANGLPWSGIEAYAFWLLVAHRCGHQSSNATVVANTQS